MELDRPAPRPTHPALSFDHWPPADRHAWEAAHRQGDFLAEAGLATTWRSASERSARAAYGRWLHWLADQNVDLVAEAPDTRFTEARLRTYVAYLQAGRAPVTVASYLGCLCMVVVALFPEQDWTSLRTLQARLRRRARPVRNKQARLVPANDLLQCGLDLLQQAGETLDRAKAPGLTPRQQVAAARDYRDGLLIALLASRPLRLRNLLAIEIGRHLRRANGRATLHFAADETKHKRVLDTVWPDSLVPVLDRYIAEVRPLLIAARAPGNVAHGVRPSGGMLWLGQGGSPLTPAGVQKALARHTTPRFGHGVNAHLFRDCVATTLANTDPDHARHAAALLGHRTLRTTERNYISVDGRLALDRHHDLIRSMRKASRQRRRTTGEFTW